MSHRAIAALVLLAITEFLCIPRCAAGTATPAPLTKAQVLALLAGDVPSSRVAMLVQEHGIGFTSNDTFLDQVRKAGGEDDLVQALQSARMANSAGAGTALATTAGNNAPLSPPSSAPPAAVTNVHPPASTLNDEAKQDQLVEHAARGAELLQHRQFAGAEAEYRAAIKLDPQESDLHMALSRALNSQHKTEEGMREAQLAIRLNPESDMAHFSLANSLRVQQDFPRAAAEYREAIRLNPNYPMTYNNLGLTLKDQGDWPGAIQQYRHALKLNPREQVALGNLGNALEHQGDTDGAITQYQQLVRLRPRLPGPHYRLGQLFEKTGETRRALAQFRIAHDLAPENREIEAAFEHAQRSQ